MRILHTADWHLGDRLGRINRTPHLRRAVERIAAYCDGEAIDVLLVAGDLFSERCTGEALRDAIDHLQRTFLPFLRGGGTIVGLTGNHDNEGFCQTLRHAFNLAAPAPDEPGGLVPCGRLHLAVGPTYLRLANRDGGEVQFVLLPYPTPSRYLDGATRFADLEEKNRALVSAFVARLEAIQAEPAFRRDLPSILGAHIHLEGARLATPFRMSEAESVILPESAVTRGWAYVALGHVHQPQSLMGLPHVRYSGSVERLDLGERDDRKGCVVVDVGPDGLRGSPRLLPLEATPIDRVVIANPREDLPRLRALFADRPDALIRFELTYSAGVDDLDAVLDELDAVFPNWYDRDYREANEPVDRPEAETPTTAPQGLHDTVVGYLEATLADAPDRDDVLRLAATFLVAEEEGPR
jgi:exonuclease SbcD